MKPYLLFLLGVAVGSSGIQFADAGQSTTCQQQLAKASADFQTLKNTADMWELEAARTSQELKHMKDGNQAEVEILLNDFTLLYDRGPAQLDVNVSLSLAHLLQLGKIPTIHMGPQQLTARWMFHGRQMPMVIGDTTDAAYYIYFSQDKSWHGPLAPVLAQ